MNRKEIHRFLTVDREAQCGTVSARRYRDENCIEVASPMAQMLEEIHCKIDRYEQGKIGGKDCFDQIRYILGRANIQRTNPFTD